jgi:hypothetical protein
METSFNSFISTFPVKFFFLPQKCIPDGKIPFLSKGKWGGLWLVGGGDRPVEEKIKRTGAQRRCRTGGSDSFIHMQTMVA